MVQRVKYLALSLQWAWVAAVAWFQSLAWELPHATDTASVCIYISILYTHTHTYAHTHTHTNKEYGIWNRKRTLRGKQLKFEKDLVQFKIL